MRSRDFVVYGNLSSRTLEKQNDVRVANFD